jgi:hypothetical protein
MTAGWASVPGWNPTRKGYGGERWWQGGREEERGREWELGEEDSLPFQYYILKFRWRE